MKSGSVLAGKYRLVSLLGSGGMGAVWSAEHLGLKAPVAIKLLAPDLDGHQDAIARFLREAQSAASLRSPHVVQVLDHGVDEATQTPFIAMELMEGESLAQRLSRVVRLSPAETSKLMTETARAVNRAHELGIVHRDLKPANLFLVRNDDDEILKVLDFGLAKWRRAPGALTQGAATATNLVMGTPYYMSPEQMNGSRDADHRSDLWALGVIAFECLTGTRPYDGDNLIAVGMKVCSAPVPPLDPALSLPAELGAWFERVLAKDPAQRFQTARELSEELRRICRADAISSAPHLVDSAPLVVAKAREVAAAPDGALAGNTAPLSRTPSGDAPSSPATGENAPSAQPVARSVDTTSAPAKKKPVRARILAGGAALAVAVLALFNAARSRTSAGNVSAPERPPTGQATQNGPQASIFEHHSAPIPAIATASESHGAETAPVARTDSPTVTPVAASSFTAPAVLPDVRNPSKAAKSGAAATRSAPSASTVAPAHRPSSRDPIAASAGSSKPIDIERKPSF
jgi:serine/threonine-protein kinase